MSRLRCCRAWVAALAIVMAFAAKPLAANTTDHPYPHAPAWVADQVVYEVNLRQFSAEGNVEGLRKQLPRLKDLGVGTLWIMPVHPIGVTGRTGKLGSPYAVKDYLQFNPELGTLDQFKSMIDQAHRMGMHVILDWVAPHTALDHTWVKQHPDWYNHDANGQLVPPVAMWKDVAGLNYKTAPMRAAMVAAMEFWVRDVGVDGFRCDSAEFVPLDFWVEARDALRKIKPVLMMAEGNKPDLMEYAFDSTYAWDFPVNAEAIAKGTKTAVDLKSYLEADAKVIASDARRLNFTSNHDKNAFEGTTAEQLKNGVAAFTVLSFTVPGIPMIFNGQENGAEHRLNLFEHDTIAWRADPMADLYSKLANLKRTNLALWETAHDAPAQFLDAGLATSVLMFKRVAHGDSVIVAVNLGGQPATVHAPADIAKMTTVVGDDAKPDAKGEITLPARGYGVWSHEE